MYDLAENDDFDREMIATYEEVAKLYPRPGVYRPIVLIAAPGIQDNLLTIPLQNNTFNSYVFKVSVVVNSSEGLSRRIQRNIGVQFHVL